MFCCTLLHVHSSIAIILMGKRELIVLLNLSSWCLVMVGRLFLAVQRGCLLFVIVVFPDHTHLLFLNFVIFFFSKLNCNVADFIRLGLRYKVLKLYKSSLQCNSVLSDILFKNELCIPLERGSNVPSTGKGFTCLSPPSELKIAVIFCSIYKKTISFSAIVF